MSRGMTRSNPVSRTAGRATPQTAGHRTGRGSQAHEIRPATSSSRLVRGHLMTRLTGQNHQRPPWKATPAT